MKDHVGIRHLTMQLGDILGDPGAVSGDGEESKTDEKKFASLEFFFVRFRLFPVPTNCPWVSEDGLVMVWSTNIALWITSLILRERPIKLKHSAVNQANLMELCFQYILFVFE